MAALHLSQHKKKARSEGAALVFEDEASFRQDSTLHSTWARRGHQPVVPVTGQRKSVKIFGCVDIFSARFLYHRDEVFNAKTYLAFLNTMARNYHGRPVYYIQDNASYHKDRGVWAWFATQRKWLTVTNLPPYSPELNAQEPLWKYTRKSGTHNKCFNNRDEVIGALEKVFRSIQKNPEQIRGYLCPFL
ncbi:MAG: IS630 family transposase [Nitrospiria bacterium]